MFLIQVVLFADMLIGDDGNQPGTSIDGGIYWVIRGDTRACPKVWSMLIVR